MADTHFPDEWLAHSLEGVVTPELLIELREKAPPPARLWETLVAQKIVSDEQILTALSTRFRLKLADLAHLDPTAKERVPEQVARRYLRSEEHTSELQSPCNLVSRLLLVKKTVSCLKK